MCAGGRCRGYLGTIYLYFLLSFTVTKTSLKIRVYFLKEKEGKENDRPRSGSNQLKVHCESHREGLCGDPHLFYAQGRTPGLKLKSQI